MSDSPAASVPPEQANGLATSLKVIFSPSEAFSTLARVPLWGWAAIIGIVLTLIGALLGLPASMHYSHIAQEQALSKMDADTAARAREVYAKIPQWIFPAIAVVSAFIIPWVAWLFNALLYLVGAALGGGDARFKMAWVCGVNVYIVAAIASVVNYSILMMRGVDSVTSVTDLFTLPSLAMFVHEPVKLAAFLYGYNVAYLWLYVVAFIALQRVMKLNTGAAIATVAVQSLCIAGITALSAR
jgi:hypothetical protein